MPYPQHPDFGTNLRDFLGPVDTEQLRQTIERQVRQTLNEIAPGVNPGMIFDILVDVTVSQAQTQVEINMGAIHTTRHIIASVPPDPQTSKTYSNWAAPRDEDSFRTEYLAAFQETGNFFDRVHDDMVDSMRYAVGIDQASGPDRTAMATDSPYERELAGHAGLMELQANPTIHLDEIRSRRFDLIDRNAQVDIGTIRPRGAPITRPQHPYVKALLQKKLAPAPEVRQEAPRPGQKLTVWERIRTNYALFE